MPARSVAHFIEAEAWNEALARISTLGEELLAEGAIGAVERWFEQIPEAVRADDANVAYLNGTCGWLRWDWVRTQRHLPPAIAGLTQPHELPRRVRALFQLVDALNSAGDLDAARARLDEVAQLPLDDLGRAQLALQRAWCLAPEGDNAQMVAHMHEFVDYAARDPARICPLTAGLIHCMLVGNPGVAETFERFVALAEPVRGPVARPWHLPLYAVDGWARVWRGDRVGAEAAMARAAAIYRQFRGIRLMSERFAQFRTLLGGVLGELDDGCRGARDDQWPAGSRTRRAPPGLGTRLSARARAHALDPRQPRHLAGTGGATGGAAQCSGVAVPGRGRAGGAWTEGHRRCATGTARAASSRPSSRRTSGCGCR